ncbi:MAG: CBS domain-containing protein, partial [Proteobacteria bacterium]|nr:CBS domain-containing protein [Pseudomonadota bacterium]
MQTAKQLLEGKGRQVWSVHSDATVYDALQLMAQKEIGALVVIDDGKMVGLVSERD